MPATRTDPQRPGPYASGLWLLLGLAAVRLVLHLFANVNYGFHRDELAIWDDAHRLAWGYVAYPPVTPALAHLSLAWFGDALSGFRLLAALAQCTAMVLTGLIARELGGDLDPTVRERVQANMASIPALTVVLPATVTDLLKAIAPHRLHVPTVQLSLDAAPGSLHALFSRSVRCAAGVVREFASRWRRSHGFLRESGGRLPVTELDDLPAGSLLAGQLPLSPHPHQDMFRISVSTSQADTLDAPILLARLLDGFVNHPPAGVSRMMALRNVLVKPLGLRTSPLGCPVSSLLSPARDQLFAGRYPVLDQHVDAHHRHAQVVLGADDKHLLFRSCVAVHVVNAHRIDISLGTRVHCKNLFGRCYMAVIQRVHRSYIAPAMLRVAAEKAFPLIAAKCTPLGETPYGQPHGA